MRVSATCTCVPCFLTWRIADIDGDIVKHTTTGGIIVEWGELVDADVGDALDAKKDSMRIGISMCVLTLACI